MKVAIVGSNRGIGLELVKQYVDAGHEVYAFCRRPSQELEQANPEKIITGFDVSRENTIKEKVSSIQDDVTFDQVVHVSGILKSDQLSSLTNDDLLEQYQVNAIGPIFSYKAFETSMKKGSKFAILSSRVGSIADNSSGNNYGYRMSKAAVNMAAKNLSMEAKEKEIAVLILHPGYVQTDMTNHNGNVTPQESARQLFSLMQEKKFSDTGTFWHANGEPLPW